MSESMPNGEDPDAKLKKKLKLYRDKWRYEMKINRRIPRQLASRHPRITTSLDTTVDAFYLDIDPKNKITQKNNAAFSTTFSTLAKYCEQFYKQITDSEARALVKIVELYDKRRIKSKNGEKGLLQQISITINDRLLGFGVDSSTSSEDDICNDDDSDSDNDDDWDLNTRNVRGSTSQSNTRTVTRTVFRTVERAPAPNLITQKKEPKWALDPLFPPTKLYTKEERVEKRVKTITDAKTEKQLWWESEHKDSPCIVDDDDVVVVKVPTLDNSKDQESWWTCPIDLGIMKIPVRSSQCKHEKCFDLYNFSWIVVRDSYIVDPFGFHTYYIKGKLECPVCNNRIKWEDIGIDYRSKSELEQFEARKYETNSSMQIDDSDEESDDDGEGVRQSNSKVVISLLDSDDEY